MDIIKELTARIEEFRATNKQPCKSYATQAAAEKAAEKAAADIARAMHSEKPARFVVFFCAPWGRWVAAFDMTEMQSRPDSFGYLGVASRLGFFGY